MGEETRCDCQLEMKGTSKNDRNRKWFESLYIRLRDFLTNFRRQLLDLYF